jgi:hypothetical protein
VQNFIKATSFLGSLLIIDILGGFFALGVARVGSPKRKRALGR